MSKDYKTDTVEVLRTPLFVNEQVADPSQGVGKRDSAYQEGQSTIRAFSPATVFCCRKSRCISNLSGFLTAGGVYLFAKLLLQYSSTCKLQ